VSCGDKYSVIKNFTFGSSRSNFSLYAKAISVVVTGGVKFGFESASRTWKRVRKRGRYHDKGDRNSALTDCWDDLFHQFALTEVDLLLDRRERAGTCMSAAGGSSTVEDIVCGGTSAKSFGIDITKKYTRHGHFPNMGQRRCKTSSFSRYRVSSGLSLSKGNGHIYNLLQLLCRGPMMNQKQCVDKVYRIAKMLSYDP
jgi:hypothetical protein